jgi:hypothetical protein
VVNFPLRPEPDARFPASGETINALAANTAIAVAPQTVLIFFCGIAGAWWTK